MGSKINDAVVAALDESKRLDVLHRECVIKKAKERHDFEKSSGKRLRPYRIVLNLSHSDVTKTNVASQIRTELGAGVTVYGFEIDSTPYYEMECSDVNMYHHPIAIVFVWYYENM